MKRRGRRRGGMSTLAAGSIALILIVIITYLGFTKFANPFSTPYTIHAIVPNANQLQPQSWVRIGGVNVGKVDSVQPADNCKSISSTPGPCSTADVTMEIQKQGLPIHKDATFAIRPRIFLEGNFFVDLKPGTPESPVAPSGYVFPIQATTVPVQTDQVLTSLQADTRRNLQILIQQYGLAVSKAGPSYNRSIQYWLPAYEYSSMVAHDSLGIQPHDLSNWLYKTGDVSAAFDTHPQNLENLVTDFNTTAAAFARQSSNLQAAVAELPQTLAVAIPAFHALNQAFCAGPPAVAANGPAGCAPGPLRQFAKALIPGVQSTTGMVNASLPFITQLRLLVQPSELGGLSTDLKNTIPSLTQLTKDTIPLLKNQVRPASSCVANVVIPWSHLTINDPHFNASNGFPPRQVYVESVDYLPGLAGESRNFDANGYYIRVLTSLGSTGVTSLSSGLIGGTLAPLVGVQPTLPPMNTPQEKAAQGRPPFAGGGPDAQGDVPNYPCETQPAITEAELNSAPSTAAPAQFPLTGTLPIPLVNQLLGLLPPVQQILARDVAAHKAAPAYKPLTAAQRAADLQTIEKYGVFATVPKSASKTTASKKATKKS